VPVEEPAVSPSDVEQDRIDEIATLLLPLRYATDEWLAGAVSDHVA